MASKKIRLLTSEVDSGDLDDIVRYNKYRIEHKWHHNHVYLGLYATINGCHHFRIKPSEEILLKCYREPENKYDKNAIRIVESNGITVGRMPRKCCEIVSPYIDGNDIILTSVFYKGKMSHGNSEDFGLGPKLVCVYFLEFKDSLKRDESMEIFMNALKSYKEFELI